MTLGYIVECVGKKGMKLCPNHETGENEFYFGSTVTVFATRYRAQRAINATLRSRPDFEKAWGMLQIVRLESEP